MKNFWEHFCNILGTFLVGIGFLGAILGALAGMFASWPVLACFVSMLWGFFLWHLRDHEKGDKKNLIVH